MHLTSHITHSNGYAPCIAYYRSNGVDQLFRKLKPKPKLNPPNAHRSPIKICEKWHTHNVQFPFMPNAFRILKPIQKSSKRVWVFHNTGANAFAKNQMRLAYEDKRDLYCSYTFGRFSCEWVVDSDQVWLLRAHRIIFCNSLNRIHFFRSPTKVVFALGMGKISGCFEISHLWCLNHYVQPSWAFLLNSLYKYTGI